MSSQAFAAERDIQRLERNKLMRKKRCALREMMRDPPRKKSSTTLIIRCFFFSHLGGAAPHDKTMQRSGFGPVGLQADAAEAAFLDQPLAAVAAQLVELLRPMRCLPEEYHALVADHVENVLHRAQVRSERAESGSSGLLRPLRTGHHFRCSG